MDSIAAKISQFKATFQELAQSFISSDFVKQAVELGTHLLEILNVIAKIIDALGGLNAVLGVTITLIAGVQGQKFFDFLNDKKNGLVSGFNTLLRLIDNLGPIYRNFTGMLHEQMTELVIDTAAAGAATERTIGVFGKMSIALDAVGISVSSAQLAFGTFTAALILIPAIIKGLADAYNKAHPSISELNKQFKELEEEQDSLQKELAESRKRIKEIEDLALETNLSFVEEAELKRLKRQNVLLEQQIALQKERIALNREKTTSTAKAEAEDFLTYDGISNV